MFERIRVMRDVSPPEHYCQQAIRPAIARAPRWFVLPVLLLLGGCSRESPLPSEHELWTIPAIFVAGQSGTNVQVFLPVWSQVKTTIVGLETSCPCLKPTNLPIAVGLGPPALVSLEATLPTAVHSARALDFQVVLLSSDGRVGRTTVYCRVLPEAAAAPSPVNDMEDANETAEEPK